MPARAGTARKSDEITVTPDARNAAAPKPRFRARFGRSAVAALRLGGAAYAAAVGLLFLNQDALIFPGQQSHSQQSARGDAQAGASLVHLRAEGTPVVALYGTALSPDGAPIREPDRRPTLLYFYGNGTWLGVSSVTLAYLRRLGVNVLIPEYPGYGLSGGHAGEQPCYAAATAAYEHLAQERHVPPDRILIAGGSLGGAVAIDLAARRPAAGLAVFNTFTSMCDMGGRLFPWAPGPLLLRHRFESEQKIARVECPVFIANGDADTFVPGWMSQRLAAAARLPVVRVTVPGAGHPDLPTNGDDHFDRALAAFVSRARQR